MPNITSILAKNFTHIHVASDEGGIFVGEKIFSTTLSLFLVQAAIIIVLSRTIHYFLYKIKQPRVIAEIIGGIVLGPSILGHIPGFTETLFPRRSLPTLSLVSSFGLVFYMFLMGLELDTGLLVRGARRFLVIGFSGMLLPGILGTIVSYGMYEFLLEPNDRATVQFTTFILFTFVAMAITAFHVLARILNEKKLLTTQVGSMTISAAAVDDIIAWMILTFVISIINAKSPITTVYVLVAFLTYTILLLFPIRMLIHKVFDKLIGNRGAMNEVALVTIFIMVFLSAWTTDWIGVHAIFGAFLMGIVMPRKGGIAFELTKRLEDVMGICFLPLYFASSGMKTKLGLINDWVSGVFLVLVILVACVGKIFGCATAARLTGLPWRESFSIGILMNTKGMVELIVLNIGLDAGIINEKIFAIMVLMALTTTFMASPLISYVYPPKYQIRAKPKDDLVLHKVSPVSRHSQEDSKILVYLKDFDSIPNVSSILMMYQKSLEPGKRLILYGLKTFTDLERSTDIMASTQTESVINNDLTLKMFKLFGNLIGVNKTECLVAASRLIEVGSEINQVVSKESCDSIIFPWQQQVIGTDQRDAAFSILNSVENTTLAIFVNKRTPVQDIHPDVMFQPSRILMPFTGGAHDRAALQLAKRLSRHSHVQLFILHLKVVGEPMDKLDKDLLEAVKESSNTRITMEKTKIQQETEFDPILETMKKSKFDLVIMGGSIRRQKSKSQLRKPSENPRSERHPTFSWRISHLARAIQRVSIEERIFGSIGNMLYSMSDNPSLLIVHDLSRSGAKNS